MSRAQHIVEQLLDEAVLLPVSRWAFKHLAEQYGKRLLKITPDHVRREHAKDIEACIAAFRQNPRPITVGDGAWWMPFPYGWRLLGENDQAKTLIGPSETISAERIENPYLPEVHKSYWRGK